MTFKPILPVMSAIFSTRLGASATDPGTGADAEIDMHRLAPGSRGRRTKRLFWGLVGASARSRSGLGAPRRSVDRQWQEYSPSAFDW